MPLVFANFIKKIFSNIQIIIIPKNAGNLLLIMISFCVSFYRSAVFPSSGHVDTAIWMHYLDANKIPGVKARGKLHKNAVSYIEQVLEATPHKAPTIRPPIQVRRTRHAGHSWRSRDELISEVLKWTPIYGLAKARRPARTYIQQLCEHTGCSHEDLLEAMNDREKWREKVWDIRASGTTRSWWWWWWWIVLKSIFCNI